MYNVTEMRNLGLSSGELLKADHYQIVQTLKEVLNPREIIYSGHSEGANVTLSSANTYETCVETFYAVCAYPNFGDTRTNSENLENKSIQQTLVDGLSIIDFGPLALPLKKEKPLDHTRFAIGGIDRLLRTNKRKILRRFKKYFSNPLSTTKLFSDKNHNFNEIPLQLIPFNKSRPDELVEDFIEFVNG